MSRFITTSAVPLRPDPDETSPSILSLDAGCVVELLRQLASWSKISALSKTGESRIGWIPSEFLKESQGKPIKLYEHPFSQTPREITGEIIEVKGALPPWTMIEARLDDGAIVDGWIRDVAEVSLPPPEQPAPDMAELDLGDNEIYRPHLLRAQEITKIDAATIAALVDAEAAKICHGPNKGCWDCQSRAPNSTATGLTQFLDGTWIDVAQTKNTLLNKTARAKGFIDKSNKLVEAKKADLLALRFDPELSIVSAAEYGVSNVAALIARGLVDANVGDDEKARYFYLAHHEGPEGAALFLKKKNSHSRKQLVAQAGKSKAERYISAAHADVPCAYRNWLNDYIDEKIQPSKFRRETLRPHAGVACPKLSRFGGPPIPFEFLGTDRDLAMEIQTRLSALGYLDPPADGIFGEVSKWALTEFAEANGLCCGDGFTETMAKKLLVPEKLLPEIRETGSWFDKVIAYMTKRNYFICRHSDCKNIVYLEGVNPDGSPNDNKPNAFNDIRIVFSVGDDGRPELLGVWEATTEPGAHYTFSPINRGGAARIAFGQYKAWGVGRHRNNHEALVQTKPVTVYRDKNRDFLRTGDRIETGLFGINQHWGYDCPVNDIKNSSAGCLVGRAKEGHRKFMSLAKADPRYKVSRSYSFVTTIMPGQDIFR